MNLEGKGVTLDVRVPITEKNERAKFDGGDPVLEAAVEVLAEEGVRIARGRLAGTSWRLQRIFAAPEAPAQTKVPEGYKIAFAEDGSLDLKTDCDLSKARYEVGAGGALAITPTISTLAACPETSLGDELATWLAASQTFQIGSDGLAVLTDGKAGVMVLLFAPVP